MSRVNIWPEPDDRPFVRLYGGVLGALKLTPDIAVWGTATGSDPESVVAYFRALSDAASKLADQLSAAADL
jgi:hypothetical protein